jgi:hypothetical protein
MPARYGSDENGYVSKFGRSKKGNTGEENIDKDDGEKPSKRKKTHHRTNSKNTSEKFIKRPSNCAVLDPLINRSFPDGEFKHKTLLPWKVTKNVGYVILDIV